MELHERIQTWREVKGLTRQQLADAVAVSVAAVYQWEASSDKSTTLPSHENLALVAKALGMTMSEFWGPLPKKRKSA